MYLLAYFSGVATTLGAIAFGNWRHRGGDDR